MNKKGKGKNKKASLNFKDVVKKYYIGYTARLVVFAVAFVTLLITSIFLFMKSFSVEEAKVINYQERGSLDYKVYLKPNDFYETDYLNKNMYYIASLIKNINVDMNYQFIIDEPANINLGYEVVGKLTISGDSGKNKLYEKEYKLSDKKEVVVENKRTQSIKENLVIDYDYYNDLANSFKQTFGVDATSDLIIYIKLYKDVENGKQIDINETSEMNLSIPLSQKTLNIKINDTGLNNSNSIVDESKVNLGNIFLAIVAFVLFVGAVALILRLLELIFLLRTDESNYDKLVKRILTEYDRLIVETESAPNLEDKNIIKIKRFQELLDARDNLKKPIMYHSLVEHHKCYFYIEQENSCYLLTVKAVDLEGKNAKI